MKKNWDWIFKKKDGGDNVKKIKEFMKNKFMKNITEILTDLFIFSAFIIIFITTYRINEYIAYYLLSFFLLFLAYIINKK